MSSQSPANQPFIVKTVNLFTLPFLATIIFIILTLPPVTEWFCKYVPDYWYSYLTIISIFFVLVYFADRLVQYIRVDLI